MSTKKATRNRNPAFPAISLPVAIKRARELHDKEKQKPMAPETAARHWDYSIRSSSALQTISALKQFGLLEEDKSGSVYKLKLSELARRILLDTREDSPKRLKALQEAALKPKIYRELWQKADEGALPSNVELQHYLILDRKPPYYEEAIPGLLKDFRVSIELAKLETCDILVGDEIDGDESDKAGHGGGSTPFRMPRVIAPEPAKLSLNVPVPTVSTQDVLHLGEGPAVLQVPNALSEASYEDLEEWLGVVLRTIKRRVRSEQPPKSETPHRGGAIGPGDAISGEVT